MFQLEKSFHKPVLYPMFSDIHPLQRYGLRPPRHFLSSLSVSHHSVFLSLWTLHSAYGGDDVRLHMLRQHLHFLSSVEEDQVFALRHEEWFPFRAGKDIVRYFGCLFWWVCAKWFDWWEFHIQMCIKIRVVGQKRNQTFSSLISRKYYVFFQFCCCMYDVGLMK